VNILIVDDEPKRHKIFLKRLSAGNNVVVVNSYYGAVREIERNRKFDLVSLDYDLDQFVDSQIEAGPWSKYQSGLDVAKYIASLSPAKKPLKAIVHSLNASRAPIMVAELEDAGIKTEYLPFQYE
jgi:CheY-like chemotaxis protein